MPIPADDDHAMVEGWKALLRIQERGQVIARRQSLAIIDRPIKRAAHTSQE